VCDRGWGYKPHAAMRNLCIVRQRKHEALRPALSNTSNGRPVGGWQPVTPQIHTCCCFWLLAFAGGDQAPPFGIARQ
jgi:hypothetical protein